MFLRVGLRLSVFRIGPGWRPLATSPINASFTWSLLFRCVPRGIASLVLHPVADVVARGVVVAAVYWALPRSVQVHRDGRRVVGVSDPVDAPIAWEHRRCTVLRAPEQVPGLPQAGMLEL